jgi:hypothetical protein
LGTSVFGIFGKRKTRPDLEIRGQRDSIEIGENKPWGIGLLPKAGTSAQLSPIHLAGGNRQKTSMRNTKDPIPK